MKKMGFKEALYIIPTLILLGIFSFWPVIQSLTYTFFDYRLNDQQKAGLYLSSRFNVDLFKETSLYVSMFLDEDLINIKDEQDQKEVSKFLASLTNITDNYQEIKGVKKISKDEEEKIKDLYKQGTELLTTLNSKYQLIHKDDLPPIMEDLNNSLISSNFIGFKGYLKALTDERIWVALSNTVIFTVFSVAIELVLGLGLALILNKAIFGQGLIRTTSLIPWAIPTAVAALMWSYLYDGSSGIIAHLLELTHVVSDSRNLLLTSYGAMISTIFADVWKTTPYMALLLLAGLQNISNSMYEAAAIDGANKVQTFFNVTMPLLKPSILVALLFRTLDAFRVFDLIYVLTGGGPGGATETLSIYGYKAMFSQTNFGYGSIVVMLMFFFVALIAIFYVKILGTNIMEKN